MCRMLAYLGEPVTLASLVLTPEHSLLRQSWAPRHQSHGVVNADGFGAGWYDHDVRPEPALYRRARPIWSDDSFASVAGLARTGAALAAVRSATPGLPVEESGTPPFCSGPWLFAHNGVVEGWRAEAGAAVRSLLSPQRMAGLRSTVDSEALFALVLGRMDAGERPADALGSAVTAVKGIAGGRLTCLLTDGRRIWGTVFGEGLWARSDERGLVVASEPFDDDEGWRALPDLSVIEGGRDGVRVTSL